MSDKICEFEKEIVKEPSQEAMSETLALHVKDCAGCREALQVSGWMKNFAASAAPKHALPTASFLLWKAKIIEKQEAGRRAAQPIAWTQTGAVILVLLTMVWFVIKFQSKFSTVLENLSASIELVAAPFLTAFVFAAIVSLAIAFKWREPSKKN